MAPRGLDFQPHEDAFITEHYRKRGARWCSDRLPGRSCHSVSGRAKKIGVAQKRSEMPEYTTNDMIDAVIRRAYTGERTTGFVGRCALAVNRRREWVAKRALALNLIQSRDVNKWTQEELDFVSRNPMVNPINLAKMMARRGWRRTPGAIAYIRTEGKVETTDTRRFTVSGLAETMGVSPSVVSGWVAKGMLKADRRGWNRTEAQGGDGYVIHERDVAKFIVQHTAHVSLTKIEPYKFWLIDLLTRCAPARSATGRQKAMEKAA